MKKITLIKARVTREIKRELKKKVERYLIMHDDNQDASALLKNYLSPFVVDEITIESSVLQKKCSFVESEGEDIFKAVIRYTELKEKRDGSIAENFCSEKLFVRADDFRDAFYTLTNYLETSTMHPSDAIVSINRFNVIDVI